MPTTNGAAAPNAEGLLGEAAWRTAVSRFLKGASVDTLTTRTRDGIAIAPLYPASDVPGEPALRRQPGAIDIVQRIDHPDPVEAGRQARTDAANGATALTLVFAGARSASPFGLPIDLDLDIAPLFDGLDPARIAVRLELPGSGCEDVLDRALGAAERQGFVRTNPAFEVAADLLGDTAFKAVPSAGTQALAGAASHWLRALGNRGLTGPAFRADGRPYHEAGGSEAQELASLLATGVFYLRVLERAGQDSPVRFTLRPTPTSFSPSPSSGLCVVSGRG